MGRSDHMWHRCYTVLTSVTHRLNTEFDLQSYILVLLHLYSLAETSKLSPPPAFGLIYEGAIG